jgi:hypothetical protein
MGLRSASFGVLDVTQISVSDPCRSARQPEEEAAALLRELDAIIAADRYFLSPRITTPSPNASRYRR